MKTAKRNKDGSYSLRGLTASEVDSLISARNSVIARGSRELARAKTRILDGYIYTVYEDGEIVFLAAN